MIIKNNIFQGDYNIQQGMEVMSQGNIVYDDVGNIVEFSGWHVRVPANSVITQHDIANWINSQNARKKNHPLTNIFK